jgi:hypothetical protein
MYQLTLINRQTNETTVESFNLKEDAQTGFFREFNNSFQAPNIEQDLRRTFQVWDKMEDEGFFEIKVKSSSLILIIEEVNDSKDLPE